MGRGKGERGGGGGREETAVEGKEEEEEETTAAATDAEAFAVTGTVAVVVDIDEKRRAGEEREAVRASEPAREGDVVECIIRRVLARGREQQSVACPCLSSPCPPTPPALLLHSRLLAAAAVCARESRDTERGGGRLSAVTDADLTLNCRTRSMTDEEEKEGGGTR